MKGCVQWNHGYDCKDSRLQIVSNPGPLDQQAGINEIAEYLKIIIKKMRTPTVCVSFFCLVNNDNSNITLTFGQLSA